MLAPEAAQSGLAPEDTEMQDEQARTAVRSLVQQVQHQQDRDISLALQGTSLKDQTRLRTLLGAVRQDAGSLGLSPERLGPCRISGSVRSPTAATRWRPGGFGRAGCPGHLRGWSTPPMKASSWVQGCERPPNYEVRPPPAKA